MKQEQINKFTNIVKNKLLKYKKLPILLFLEDKQGKITIHTFTIIKESDKERMVYKINKILQTKHYKSYLFISESWILRIKKAEAVKLPISDNPNKQECMTITYRDETGNKKITIIPFKRDKDNIIIKENETQTSTEYVGTFDFQL